MSTRAARDKLRKQLQSGGDEQLTCKPLDSFNEILKFLENPPPWRTLCRELRPHSKEYVSNMDNLKGYEFAEIMLGVADYCHFDPDAEDPGRYDITEQNKPKTLVCHDLANGYHDDSHIDGTVNYDSYTFYNWAGIDIFCYFSHHLITIPPLGWINVAHDHGVKIIGTVITEWAEGVLFWDKVLDTEARYQQFASALVAIAKTMKFDGWLLNIENKVNKPELLLEFVSHLHKLLHSELKDPVLIWYDSVTINGKLSWQNKLNEKNKPFFDACDGFFINYSWSVADLEQSVMAAGSRVTDVYVGIDVWGRNFYCGGQFNTYEAIKIAYNEGLSLAIFAPGWTFEAMTTDRSEPNYVLRSQKLGKLQVSLLRDRALWTSIWPYLHTRVPCHLPFQTSFCRGQGKKRWMYGEVISPGPWYNLRLQQYQPNSMLSQHGYHLSHYDESKKEKKKGGLKQPTPIEQLQVEQDVASLPPTADEDEPKPLKVVDSLQRIASPGSPSPTESIETRPKVKHVASDATRVTPILKKKSFLRTCLDLFICKSSPEVEERKTDGFYETEKVVSHSTTVGTSAIATTSKLKKTGDQAVSSRSSSPKEGRSPDRPSTPVSPRTPERSRESSPVESRSPAEASTDKGALPTRDSSAATSVDLRDLTRSTRTSMITTSIYLNLRQPDVKTRWVLSYLDRERECLQVYMDDAFTGGTCLRVNPSDAVSQLHRTSRLFHCDFKCDKSLIVCVVSKAISTYADQYLNVRLKMKNANDEDLRVILLGRNLELPTSLHQGSVGIHYAYPMHSEEQKDFQALREYLLLHQPGFYVPIDNFYGWEVRYYKVNVPGSRVFQVNLRTELPQGGILLGHLGICEGR